MHLKFQHVHANFKNNPYVGQRFSTGILECKKLISKVIIYIPYRIMSQASFFF